MRLSEDGSRSSHLFAATTYIMILRMICVLCGEKLRKTNRRGICRRHGYSKTFDQATGQCNRCGRWVPTDSRGGHATGGCALATGVWNAGLTTKEDARLVSKFRGTKRPELTALFKKLWQDPKYREKCSKSMSK